MKIKKHRGYLSMCVLVSSVVLFGMSQTNYAADDEQIILQESMSEPLSEPLNDKDREDMSIELEDAFDEEFMYPNGKSDLEPVRFATRDMDRATGVSITDKNRPTSNFIDVSSHNGLLTVEHYRTMKSYGVTGVVVKLTEGLSYRNPYAASQIKNAQAAGLIVSAYHYTWFTSEEQAGQEANYFVRFANELGLPKSTLMVNDIEDPKIKYEKVDHTANSLAFQTKLNQSGYNNVNHYIGLHWMNEGRIDVNKLGKQSVWVAAYPYNPTAVQLHTDLGAWQWTSSMTFPKVPGVFDMSSDYQGRYSLPSEGSPGNYIPDGRYMTINQKGYDIYSNFKWKKKDSTDRLYGKTYLAKGHYDHSNGLTYYSLYDSKDNWIGYLYDGATKVSSKEGGYIADGRYAFINKKGYTTWQNFNWEPKNNTANLYEQTYLARGRYEHFDGSVYYSLYDQQNNWQGYLNSDAMTLSDKAQGNYMSDGRYVSISQKDVPVWSNFDWGQRNNTTWLYQNTYLAKGRYNHFNGKTYVSLFDGQDNWQGYVEETATRKANGRQGNYIADGRYVTINKKGYNTWSNFSWKELHTTDELYGKTYQARGRYQHINGSTYYSLFDHKGNWQGYLSEKAVVTSTIDGAYVSDKHYVTIDSPSKVMYSNFSGKVRKTTQEMFHQTYEVRGKYTNFSGHTYYSLYDNKGIWQGYTFDNAFKRAKGEEGIYLANGEAVTITKKGYNVWSNFNWKKKNHTNQLVGNRYIAKGEYHHYNGSIYYSLYDAKGEWCGYVNKNATR